MKVAAAPDESVALLMEGGAHYQVRKDLSICHHWQLVCCALSLWSSRARAPLLRRYARSGRGKKEDRYPATTPVVAAGAAEGALVAGALRNAVAILEGVLRYAPASGAKKAA